MLEGSSPRALVPAQSESSLQADPRFSMVEQLVCDNLGYALRSPRERIFPWSLCLCSFVVSCAVTAVCFWTLQAGEHLADARLMLNSYKETAASMGPKVTQVLTENATVLGRTLNITVGRIDSHIQEVPNDAERFTQLQLSVLEKPTSAWGIQLAFGKLEQLQDAEVNLRHDFDQVLENMTAFLQREWIRHSVPLLPLLADLKGLIGMAPSIFISLRQTPGFWVINLHSLIPILKRLNWWDETAQKLHRFLMDGDSGFADLEQRLAEVTGVIKSLQTDLQDTVALLKQEVQHYDDTLTKAQRTVEDFRVHAEDQRTFRHI